MSQLWLDGTKLALYPNRVAAWKVGKRVAPITVDMSLTRSCNFNCVYCYGKLQENKREPITAQVIKNLYDDFAELGVQGVSLVSDGESTLSPFLELAVLYGRSKGLAMALGTNGAALTEYVQSIILPKLTYLRYNISAGTKDAYNAIMRPRVKDAYKKVIDNIKYSVKMKKWLDLDTTIGMQMVLMPQFANEILPLTKLAISLGVDYLIIKHCSDDEHGSLGVDYSQYKGLESLLKKAEGMSTEKTKIVVKWSKIGDGNKRTYQQCYGAQFILQISGSGLVAPCGMFFGEKYKQYHIGNITKKRFKDIFKSKKYRDVMAKLASPEFNAQKECGCLCLQHSACKFLDSVKKTGKIPEWEGEQPKHQEFI